MLPSTPSSRRWQAGRFLLDVSVPRVMGIVNVTPDSFSDGGRFLAAEAAKAHAERLLEEGADVLDIGAESTRPGSPGTPADEQWLRLEPVLAHVLSLGCPVSVDTSDPLVMRQCIDVGVDIINDVRALQRPGALDVVACHAQLGLCLMHMQGEPQTMQLSPAYGDITQEVHAFLDDRLRTVLRAGVAPERVLLDPGFGFGKSLAHNVTLAKALPRLQALGRPLLVGWSRKGSLGQLTGRSVNDRVVPSVAAALAAVAQGASVLRVHDVAATVDALKVWQALGPQAASGQQPA